MSLEPQSLLPYQQLLGATRISKEGIGRWQCSRSAVSMCRRIVWTRRRWHRVDRAAARLLDRSDRSRQSKKKSFPVGWLRVRGKAEQGTECDHATSFCGGVNGGQYRDLLLALHAGGPTSGFAHGAGPGCARGGPIKKSARPPRHARTSAGASSITAKVVRAKPSNRSRVAFFTTNGRPIMNDSAYAAFAALDPFFDVVQKGARGSG